MWHRDGPTFPTDNVWVGISFDRTKLWQASFVHFAVGDLGSHMPLGSWILLRGSEKKAIISQLAAVYDLNADLTEVAQQQIPDKGGYLRKVICFFIADTKAQVILGGCSFFTAKNPAATVCWLCGKNRATILHEFGCGMGVIVEEWLWAGMICPIVRPAQRPPDYGLHGVHRQVHNGLSALVNSLHTVHRWKRGKAVRWVQWFLDPIRIQARTATGVALEEERKDKKKVPRKIEQTAAAEWVKMKVLPWVVVGAGGLGAGKTSGAGTRGVFLDVVIGGRTRDTDTNGGESSDNRSKVHADCGPAENPSL